MAIAHSQYAEAGAVSIDAATCKHCRRCVRICPAEVLRWEDDHVRVADDSPFGCIACGHCMMVCPEGSITVTGRGLSPRDLMPLPAPEDRTTADALSALLLSRRSVRRFRDAEVAQEVLDRVVGMAATAPMGIPPWDIGVVIVRGKERVREIADRVVDGYEGFLRLFRPWVLTAMRPFVRRTTHDQYVTFIRPLAEAYVAGRRSGRDLVFYGAPALIIFHRSPFADAADCAIACTYAMLAAESLGLGSTIIGGAPPVLQRNRALCCRLGIPEGNTPALALILGYPAVEFASAIRRRFAHVNTIT